MAIDKFRVGDLVWGYPSHGKLYEGNVGIATEVIVGRAQDEPHVKVRLPNGAEELRDVGRMRYAGRPMDRTGKVIVKWLDDQPGYVGLHQEWSAEMFTETGWALARDTWGQPHWLPPREQSGDIQYVFRHSDERHVVAMQTVVQSSP